MNRTAKLVAALALAMSAVFTARPVFALEAQSPTTPAPAVVAPDPVAGVQAGAPTIDPMLRAVLIGLAASVLRDAASSPDPLGSVGNTVERVLTNLLQSPATAKLAEGLVGMVAKDAPEDLREPLVQFAMSMVNSLRRDMARDAKPRFPY